jgi:hypothetical protein
MVGCLKIIEMLLDTSAGINAIMTVGNIKQIAFLIETEDQGVQTEVLRLLAAVCLLPPKGHDLVEGTSDSYTVAFILFIFILHLFLYIFSISLYMDMWI